jgi:hypothetical protein
VLTGRVECAIGESPYPRKYLEPTSLTGSLGERREFQYSPSSQKRAALTATTASYYKQSATKKRQRVHPGTRIDLRYRSSHGSPGNPKYEQHNGDCLQKYTSCLVPRYARSRSSQGTGAMNSPTRCSTKVPCGGNEIWYRGRVWAGGWFRSAATGLESAKISGTHIPDYRGSLGERREFQKIRSRLEACRLTATTTSYYKQDATQKRQRVHPGARIDLRHRHSHGSSGHAKYEQRNSDCLQK